MRTSSLMSNWRGRRFKASPSSSLLFPLACYLRVQCPKHHGSTFDTPRTVLVVILALDMAAGCRQMRSGLSVLSVPSVVESDEAFRIGTDPDGRPRTMNCSALEYRLPIVCSFRTCVIGFESKKCFLFLFFH